MLFSSVFVGALALLSGRAEAAPFSGLETQTLEPVVPLTARQTSDCAAALQGIRLTNVTATIGIFALLNSASANFFAKNPCDVPVTVKQISAQVGLTNNTGAPVAYATVNQKFNFGTGANGELHSPDFRVFLNRGFLGSAGLIISSVIDLQSGNITFDVGGQEVQVVNLKQNGVLFYYKVFLIN